MENASYIAVSHQAALWRQMEIVANNMANVNTPAYKAEQAMFTDYLVEPPATPGVSAPEPVVFVQDIGVLRDTREGPMTVTDNPLDLAIQGPGHFVIDTPDGPRYTRHGNFHLDATGMLVTAAGHAVMQEGDMPIVFAPNESSIDIGRDGTVSTENGPIGRLRIVRFDNEQELRKVADGLYETAALPEDAQQPDVLQGMIEESNVKPVIEMTNLIAITRSYQAAQQMIDNEHQRAMKAYQVLSGARTS